MKSVVLALALSAATFGAAGATESVSQAPVDLPGGDGLYRLVLPLPVLQASRSARWADLEFVNAAGERLPWAWLPNTGEAAEREQALPMFAWPQAPQPAGRPSGVEVRVDAAGAVLRIDSPAGAAPAAAPVTWLLDASRRQDGEQLEALSLDWAPSPEPQVRELSVDGSDDLVHWQALGGTTLVDLPAAGAPRVLHQRWQPAQPLAAPKYLRIHLDRPLPLNTVNARWQAPGATALEHTALNFVRDAGAEPASWTADLGAPLALRSLQLALPQPNTVLLLALEQEGEDHRWQEVSRQTVYRVTREGRELVSPAIALHAAASRRWRLRLLPPSPGLQAATLEAQVQWPQLAVVFVARAPRPVSLQIGREGARAGELPLSSVLPAEANGHAAQLPRASVGALVVRPVESPGWGERLRHADPADQRRWVLWAVLVGAVVLLAALARGLWKELGQRPPADG